jgi:CelD/BcsL family acetyltransferase involved in cellulose biosynthesis
MLSASRAEVIPPAKLDEARVTDAWRRLAEARSNPFLTPEWFAAWTAERPEEEPHAIGWWVGEELRGVLPLVAVREGRGRLLRFAGARRGDWFTPACAASDEKAMGSACAALLAEEGGWHSLCLDRIDRESAWPAALWAEGSGPRLRRTDPRRTDVLPYIRFEEGGWDGYLAARSRNFRSQLGRRRRKLEREHGLAFRLCEDADRLEADLDTFFRLHGERWEERGGSSSGDAETQRFQRRFAASAMRQGWLRLWIAEADGEAAGAWYGWRIGERYCYALSGLGRAWEPLALGTVLLGHTIEQAALERAEIYDMMWGEESYKERFETGRREAATWVLGRPGDPRSGMVAARTSLERSARRLRARLRR